MTPRPGGEAAKLGGHFEAAWTVRMALEVLHGRASAILLEPDPPLGFGAEFVLDRRGVLEAHQVKRQHGLRNGWTIAALEREGVLDAAGLHADDGREFHFVSMVPCRPLQELADRARGAANARQLSERLSAEALGALDRVSNRVWNSEQRAYLVLRSLHVCWPQPDMLQSENAILAAAVLDGAPPDVVVAALMEIVTSQSGRTFDRDSLLVEAETRGLRPRDAPAPAAPSAIAKATRTWLMAARDALLRPPIERPEAKHLEELLTDSGHRLVMAVGEAGAGKTAVLADVVERFCNLPGWHVLALRLDRASGVTTTQELGEPVARSTSPVRSLVEAAKGGPCLLVVDQLDAVSFVAGRDDRLFEVVRDLLHEAAAFPQMRVLLACRRFDLLNDSRFRELTLDGESPHRFTVPELGDEQVEHAIAAMKLDPSVLSREQRILLRSPFRLVVFDQIRRARAAETEPDARDEPLAFASAKDLLDRYWTVKRRACRPLRDPPVQFDEVIFALAQAMSEKRRLAIPEALLPGDLAEGADVLASEGVLRETDRKLAFFHEAFFDYAFARAWVKDQRDLVAFLLGTEQDLFRRAQVRQVLLHLHDDDPDTFARQLEQLLISDRVRFHLKQVAIGVVGTVAAPSPTAWGVVARVLETADPEVVARLRAALRTPGWFELLTHEGVLVQWLADPAMRDQAFGIMAAAARESPDRVAAVLRPRIGDPRFQPWIRDVARFADLSDSRPLFELILDSVGRGIWDGYEQGLWMYADDLADRPEWAVELLAACLVNRPGALDVEDGKIAAISRREHRVGSLVTAAAKGAPRQFWESLGDWLLRVMAATSSSDDGDRPLRDRHFGFRSWPPEGGSDLDDALIVGAAAALRALATGDDAVAHDELRVLLEPLATDPHDAAQWLLYEALRAAGPRLADFAADTLLEGSWRFRSGYRNDPYWATRELLAAITPHVSDDRYAQLEAAVLDFRSPSEGPGDRYSQHTLLDGFEAARLSEPARRRRDELDRLYGSVATTPGPAIVSGYVQSPVPGSAIPHMTDEHWRRALLKHAGRERDDTKLLVGGAEQLASQLREQTSTEPARFLKLGVGPEVAADPTYVDGILHGLRETKEAFEPQLAFAFVRHVASLDSEHDKWLGEAMRPVRAAEIPDDILELLIDRALNAADPVPGAGHVIRSTNRDDDEDDYSFNDPFTDGMNRARGSLVLTLADLLLHDEDGSRTVVVAKHLRRFARDPSPSVRSCVARLIRATLRHAEAEAVEAYPLAAADQDEALATQPFEELTVFVARRDIDAAITVANRMLRSGHERVRRGGGRIAAYLGLEHERPDLVERVVQSSDPATRRGAARICAQWPTEAAPELQRLLRDAHPKVREAAAEVASGLRGEPLRPHSELLLDLIEGPCFETAVTQLLITLEQAPDRVDDLILAAARRFVGAHLQELGDIRTAAAAEARGLSNLVIRAHAQATGEQARYEALDLVDDLLRVGAYGVENALLEVER